MNVMKKQPRTREILTTVQFIYLNGFLCSYTICHKTEVIKNTLNPKWKSMEVPVRTLCNGDHERTIKVEVYDWDRDGGCVLYRLHDMYVCHANIIYYHEAVF